jgi:hypothetical protein
MSRQNIKFRMIQKYMSIDMFRHIFTQFGQHAEIPENNYSSQAVTAKRGPTHYIKSVGSQTD